MASFFGNQGRVPFLFGGNLSSLDSTLLEAEISFCFDSAPLWAESGIVSDTRSSGFASPRQRRQMFVSASLHYLAMPLSSGSLAPFVNVVGFNTQPCQGKRPRRKNQSYFLLLATSKHKKKMSIREERHPFAEPLVGFEPTTPRLQITCSGQLS
jgi:hypothetical protein